ncbi:hematopoietic progenitor cell antigen CD34 [Seriola dumerili]|uniref:hematopoietic progenitor cell antigen CD34 n=1 Tax=Seriola dumerili TaxID=41447 RepID=UPI000BBF215A|nr:hematopoietic progenitor cell antigen CD34 [Seriola dumerili]
MGPYSGFTAGVVAQDEEVVTATATSVETDAYVRGDMIPKTTEAPEPEDPQEQTLVFPTMESVEPHEQTTAATATEETEETGDVHNEDSSPAAPEEAAEEGTQFTVVAHSVIPLIVEAETPAPMPSRGDGPRNKPVPVPVPVPQDDVVCVPKETVQDKNAVSLKLKATSSCEDTKVKIESVLQELCGEDCKLEIYQADNSDEIIVSGKYVEADVAGMANKFNNDNIKDKTDVEEAVPRWGKNSKLVLVTLLLTGLLLAALLVAGYYLKTHRKNSKGVRLAESFQVDEENQANTLVSVAPLPQEPLDKLTANGESPPENGTNPAPTTNGHSQTQTPVADTEM